MAKQPTAASTPEVKEKKTRTILTPQQRIEKAKAELEALEAKEQGKAKAKLDAAVASVDKLKAKAAELETKIAAAESEVVELKKLAGIEDTTTDES